VIVAVPIVLAVTKPEDDTVATEVLLDVQVTVLLVAFEGVTVATRVSVNPSCIVRDVLFRLTPCTGTFTVIEHDAVFPPSSVLTVMVADPPATALT
jgi:hypothetical protein